MRDIWSVREQLNQLREMNGVLYAYTSTKTNDGQMQFLVDGMPKDNTEDVGVIGTKSTISLDVVKDADQNGFGYSGIEETEYGAYTGLVPLKDSSGETYVYLGVDIDAVEANAIAVSMTEYVMQEMKKSSEDVQAGNHAVQQIGEQLVQIDEAVNNVNNKVVSDSAVIEEISAGSEEILASAEDMNALVIRNANETTEVAKEAELQVDVTKELEQAANEILMEIEKFKI